MRINKIKTRKGKKFLDERGPKREENDKTALVIRGSKTTDVINQALNELFMLKKPLVNRLMRKNAIHPFEDDTMLCKFSHKFDSSLFVFGANSKKRPNTLTFGRMYDHQMLDMQELRVEKFISSAQFKNPNSGISVGTKPCILLQGPLFESDEKLKRLGNLMVDWFRGARTDLVRLQGLELVIVLTALSEERILFRVYKSSLKKAEDSSNPRVELAEIGPHIDFKVDRDKLASENLYKTALRKPKITGKSTAKNVKIDAFGSKVAKVHTGRQQVDEIQTRKVKAIRRPSKSKG